MRRQSILWFASAVICCAAAVFIFAGRTMLAEAFDEGVYRTLVIVAYLALGGAAGSLAKAFSASDEPAS
ncbi:hypothetical protein [Arthrobacter flavus]|uniref:Uncharacterized protein n=1 Tax=Arthrobacter flavus TaxID=95172 RepID=A0ABW4Q9A5_9MICC